MPLLAGTIVVGSFIRPVAAGLALRLYGATSGYVGLAPAAEAGSTTYILPAADGTSGQALLTDGSGSLQWGAAGATDHGALDGLADDDHPQYLRCDTLSAEGDLLVQGDSTATRLPVGTAGQCLSISAGLPSWTSITTDEVHEGTALYFTAERARAALTGAASTIVSYDLAASAALASDESGKVIATDISATELGFLAGVTGNLQTQLDGKQPTITTLDVTLGGTGLANTPGNGELLIGNGSGFTLTTLTAGENVEITPGAGSITISAAALSTSPGGSDTAIQFNDAGDFGGSDNLAWNNSTQTLLVNHIVSSAESELVLEQTGDSFGTTRFRLQNRLGVNGFLVENATLDLVDLVLSPSSEVVGLQRFEHRSEFLHDAANTEGEFQFIPASSTFGLVVGAHVSLCYTHLKLQDACDIVCSDVTGTRIATAATQKLGFFGATPVTQRAKANYNDWASLADVVQALVDLGLFDQI